MFLVAPILSASIRAKSAKLSVPTGMPNQNLYSLLFNLIRLSFLFYVWFRGFLKFVEAQDQFKCCQIPENFCPTKVLNC
jgi:hypothetical protein